MYLKHPLVTPHTYFRRLLFFERSSSGVDGFPHGTPAGSHPVGKFPYGNFSTPHGTSADSKLEEYLFLRSVRGYSYLRKDLTFLFESCTN